MMKTEIRTDNVDRDEVYRFLRRLRDSGKTNMFGAGPYLIREFGFDRKTAISFLTDWMRDFSK
jgi:hypothetical protein